jgi:rubrerythrin
MVKFYGRRQHKIIEKGDRMNTFTAGDVLQFAIRLEENGELFYRKAAAATDNKAVTDLFTRLADEEIKHKKIFEDLFSQARWIEPAESYPGEYFSYLRNYMDGRIVFSADLKGELPGIHGTVEALNFAIQRELDSILYYQELKVFVPQKDFATLDAIIAEERKHFAALSEAKKDYK